MKKGRSWKERRSIVVEKRNEGRKERKKKGRKEGKIGRAHV